MATKAKTHAHYERAVAEIINDLPSSANIALPRVNDKTTRAWQRYAVCRMAFSSAKQQHDIAREAVLAASHIPPEPGTHMLHDSPHVVVTAQVKAPAMRLDETKLLMMLGERCDVTIDEARAMLDKCRSPGEPAVQLSVTLKR